MTISVSAWPEYGYERGVQLTSVHQDCTMQNAAAKIRQNKSMRVDCFVHTPAISCALTEENSRRVTYEDTGGQSRAPQRRVD